MHVVCLIAAVGNRSICDEDSMDCDQSDSATDCETAPSDNNPGSSPGRAYSAEDLDADDATPASNRMSGG